MLRTIEAIIDEEGRVHLLEEVKVPSPRRVLVTILDEIENFSALETAQLSEESLAADWCRLEEDEAWTHLQSGQ